MHYTLSYIEGNEREGLYPTGRFDFISDCINWCKLNMVDFYLFYITEWGDELDGYGTPEINATVNLQSVVDDNEVESLSKYQTY